MRSWSVLLLRYKAVVPQRVVAADAHTGTLQPIEAIGEAKTVDHYGTHSLLSPQGLGRSHSP